MGKARRGEASVKKTGSSLRPTGRPIKRLRPLAACPGPGRAEPRARPPARTSLAPPVHRPALSRSVSSPPRARGHTHKHSCALPCPPARLNLSLPFQTPPGRPSSRVACPAASFTCTSWSRSGASCRPAPVQYNWYVFVASTPPSGRACCLDADVRCRAHVSCLFPSPFQLCFGIVRTHCAVHMRYEAARGSNHPSAVDEATTQKASRGVQGEGPSHRTLPARRNERPGWR